MHTSLLTSGKLQGQMLMATSNPGPFFASRQFFVIDRITGTRFLVDTGADEVSVIPPSPADRVRQQDGLVLRAANDSIINTRGTHSCMLDLGLQHQFPWVSLWLQLNGRFLEWIFCDIMNS